MWHGETSNLNAADTTSFSTIPARVANPCHTRRRIARADLIVLIVTSIALLTGCAPHPHMLPNDQQKPIDRSVLRYPTGSVVQPYIRGLTAATAMAWQDDGSILIAQGGNYDEEPSIIGFKRDGSFFQVYPKERRFPLNLASGEFKLYGPIGGMLVYKGRIYVSHRDENGKGRITAIEPKGGHTTIAANLPAQGDYSITDLAIDTHLNPPRLFFGVGSATNSGVVGLDNWEWLRDLPKVHDMTWARVHLRGYRFDSPNPFSGLFGPADIAVTAPLQPFNVSNETEVDGVELPNAAIYSCSPSGGDLHVEAHGIRYPRGLAFNGYSIYFTNQGMELRGTRPVRNDPDALLWLIRGGTWYGWPDYTADLQPVSDDKFQPAPLLDISRTGYKRVLFVIDQEATEADPKNQQVRFKVPIRDTLLQGAFAPLSGAAKLDFVPAAWPDRNMRGRAIVALGGDRAPFSTSGLPMVGPIGYKVVSVDLVRKQVEDFIANTAGGPASHLDPKNPNLLERPIDVKFGPDGSLFILDAGRMQIRDGRETYEPGTGQIFRLVPVPGPVMQP
jgi:glucose/arabinose dehydrogenase